MEIQEIKKIFEEALRAPQNTELQGKYGDAIAKYLKEKKSTDEILTIVISGIDIDRAANYFDFLQDVSKNDLQIIMKQVRQNKQVKEGIDDHVLKFLSGMLSQAFMKAGNMESQCGNIMTLLMTSLASEKKPVSSKIYAPIFLDYIVEDLYTLKALPKWETIKASEEIYKHFAEIIVDITEDANDEKYKSIRTWASWGIRYADDLIKKKKIEAKIPKSRVSDLQELANHYRDVEKQLRNGVYEAAKLEDTIEELHKQIESMVDEKRKLEGQIRELNAEIAKKQDALDKANKEVDERKSINDAFGALKKNDESALLSNIADELKSIYSDFKDTASEDMDVELGEIYRDHLKNVFKKLADKGITME